MQGFRRRILNGAPIIGDDVDFADPRFQGDPIGDETADDRDRAREGRVFQPKACVNACVSLLQVVVGSLQRFAGAEDDSAEFILRYSRIWQPVSVENGNTFKL